ncbi:PTS system, beta-glucoside-specific IIB component / PTS system, beta-glucoside-specific IIC component / PTS system, beta-glucoside-specific IIA component [Carnobacterium antarcticum]|nr:PTS system, beta-glucoside-specific IIB component / PTS system, beta-glucoside-specific IIC component / PTS system, beta-glucoside-specific IIA component [Carnobacterium sp. CP1]
MAMDYKIGAKEILEHIGGKENISGMTHCATRLRFNLRDTTKADTAAVEQVDGVVNVINKAGQYQILIGTNVPKLYAEMEDLVGADKAASTESTKADRSAQGIIGSIFSAISSIFAPLLPALAGSGILRGLLLLFVQLGWLSEASGTYQILSAASMTVFYFLPVLLAITSARRFGADMFISALIGAALLHPDFIALLGDIGNGATTTFLGIPTILMNYNSTVVPIILAIWVFSYLYKWLDRVIPETLKLVVLPLVSVVVMVPLTIIVIGPLGVYGGEVIASAVNWLIARSSILAGIVVGGGWSVLVSLGIHWAVNPIMINNVATYGLDYIVPFTFACNFATIGTALGVLLKAKDRDIRSFSITGMVTIALSAIIEPTVFGLLLKNKKLFMAQIIGGAVGGAYLGLTNVYANAFVFGSVTTFPAFVGENSSNFINAMIGLAISLIVAAVIAYFVTRIDEKLIKN